MKIINNTGYLFTLMLALMLMSVGCEDMDENYKDYLEDTKVYSPKINNLRSYNGLREVSLAWDNPVGSIAKQIVIDYQDSVLTTETLIDSIRITNLDIKGYTMTVYTLDAFGNYSVPTAVQVFPNGE